MWTFEEELISDMRGEVEQLIAETRAETERAIQLNSQTRDGRQAWYWSYIGGVDMLRQLDLITDQRRQELYAEARELFLLACRDKEKE